MRLTVEPDVIALSPGDTADLLVRVANDGEEVCTPFLAARGIDPDDVLLPSEVVAVGPGEVMTAIVRVRASADATPGDQRIAVAAEDLQGGQRPVSATTLLRVGARPDVAVQVEPVATAGRNRAKATTILRNRSDRRLQIDLEASGDGVAVRFRPGRVALDPGETRRVRTRLRRTRRSWFAEIRHGAVVTARGIGAPASTTLTFTQRPAIPRVAVRGLAAFMALTVWVAASVVVFQRLNAEDPAPTDSATAVGPAAPGPGRTSATGLFEEPEPEGVSLPVVIQGTVEGPRDPSGTLVTAERISFGDEGTTTGLTKVAALTPVKLPRGAVLDRVEVTTDERGRFRIASGLQSESFYRVTATRAGFEVGSFIVSTTDESPEVTLAIALDPAPGILAGRVVDAAGVAIGGASVLVTDGTLTYSTTTASEGLAAGTWTIEGVATPSTYEVVVTRLGYASQTLIVDVEGGQALRSVDATLIADRGTLRGTVRAVDPVTGQTAGVGGIDIALAGEEARTTRTITAPANLRGGFTFPALPYGVYELTFSAPGWETRVAEVTVDSGDVVLNVSDLVRSTGVVQGHVWQVVRGVDTDVTNITECRYPRLSQREDAETLARPCGGVSVSVTDDDGNVFASASATSTGFFQVDGVPAGEYSVRLSRAGYIDHVERIVLTPGGLQDLTPDHTTQAPDPITLGLRPALSACLGTVELIVVQRVLQSGSLTPVVVGTVNDPQSAVVPPAPAVAPAGIRVPASFDFECDTGQSPPEWFRVDDNIYRLTNVPLGQTPIEVAFEGLQPTETILAVTADGVASATVQVAPEPRDIGGTVRVVSNGAGAERNDVRIRVLDENGTPVTGKEVTVDATTSVDLGSGVLASEATFTIPRVDVDADYRLTIDGPGITPATSSLFTLTAGGTPFDPGRQDVQARTTVSGTVRGFTTSGSTVIPADLSGATITFTPAVGSALAPIASGAGGTFSLELDAGPYDVTVTAPGYATRTFSSVDLIGTAASPTQLLQPTTAPYAAYPTIAGTAGDVGLTPSARTVQVDVTLDGATGATRAARVELVGGTIGGVATTTPSHTDTATITVDDAAGTGRFTFESVPVGAYTLNVVPTDGAAEGIAHTAATVVVGHDAAAAQLDTSTTAQAMSRIAGRVVGFDVFTMALEPLSGATISAPAAPYTATTGASGSFSLLVPSGAYGTGAGQDFAAITVAPTGSVYETRTVTGTVSALAGALPGVGAGQLFLVYPGLGDPDDGDIGLSPGQRQVDASVSLLGSTSPASQRDVAVRLVAPAGGSVTLGAGTATTGPYSLTATGGATVTAGTPKTFSSSSVLPGRYRVEVSTPAGSLLGPSELLSVAGSAVAPGAYAVAKVGDDWFVDIQPGAGPVALSATVQARTVVNANVVGFAADLSHVGLAGAILTLDDSSAARAVSGATVIAPPPEGKVGFTLSSSFSIEVDAGVAIGVSLVAPGYAASPFTRTFAAAAETLSGAAADVVLSPLPRDVQVRVALDGAAGASRTFDLRLTGGLLDGTALPDITESITVTQGTPLERTFKGVPVGRYDLIAVATDSVASPATNEVVVAPDSASPTAALDLRPVAPAVNLEVQATVTMSGSVQERTTTDDDGAVTTVRGLAGASIDAAVGLVPVGRVATVASGVDGSFSIVLRSGASGDLTLALTGYSDATVSLVDLEGAGGTASPLAPVTLVPTGVRVEGSVTDNVSAVRAIRTDGTADNRAGTVGTAEGGRAPYSLPSLDVGVGWTIEFVGVGDVVLARRYINSPTIRTVILDQDALPADLGSIVVTVAVPLAPAGSGVTTPTSVSVRLDEAVPSEFYSIGAAGTMTETSGAGADSGSVRTFTVTFSGLAKGGSSPSLPLNRFIVTLDPVPAGYALLSAGSFASVEVGGTAAFNLATRPGAPEDVAATPGDGQLVASWDAPASDGGSPITAYSVELSDGTTTSTCTPNPTTATTCTEIGLTNGTSYTIIVTATNAVGVSAASTSVTATPRTVPDAPMITAITPGDQQLSVAFSAPGSDGGAAIANYEYSTNGGSTWTARDPAATSSPLVITGLTNGTTYQVALRAVNSAGPGLSSANVAATPVSPASPPGAPQITTITPGDQQLSVAFSAPTSDGGAAIANYEYSTNGGSTWTARDPAATSSPLVITGLTNGTTYQVALRAVNSAGPGAASGTVQGVPSAVAWRVIASEIHQVSARALTDPASSEVAAGRIDLVTGATADVEITTTYNVSGVGLGYFRAALIDRASSGDLLNGNFGCGSCGAIIAGGRHFDNADVEATSSSSVTGSTVLISDGATVSGTADRITSINVTVTGGDAVVTVKWVLASTGTYSLADGVHLVVLYTPSS